MEQAIAVQPPLADQLEDCIRGTKHELTTITDLLWSMSESDSDRLCETTNKMIQNWRDRLHRLTQSATAGWSVPDQKRTHLADFFADKVLDRLGNTCVVVQASLRGIGVDEDAELIASCAVTVMEFAWKDLVEDTETFNFEYMPEGDALRVTQ